MSSGGAAGGAAGAAAAAGAIIAQAIKASGAIVEVEAEDFQNLVNREEKRFYRWSMKRRKTIPTGWKNRLTCWSFPAEPGIF